MEPYHQAGGAGNRVARRTATGSGECARDRALCRHDALPGGRCVNLHTWADHMHHKAWQLHRLPQSSGVGVARCAHVDVRRGAVHAPGPERRTPRGRTVPPAHRLITNMFYFKSEAQYTTSTVLLIF